MQNVLDHSYQLSLTSLRSAETAWLVQVGAFAMASLILAFEPIIWLWRTWTDPSYGSHGWPAAALVAVIVVWSLSSPVVRSTNRYRRAFLLLLAAAVLRLASQVLAISVMGGFALTLDVFALLMVLRVSDRARAVSPLWIAGLFAMSLPLERIVQRALGYPMQEISAAGACSLLRTIFDTVICDGVRLHVAGQDVLVDLPCSGTQALMLCVAIVFALFAVQRPKPIQAAFWLGLTLVLAIASNAVRITIIAVLLVQQDATGIDPMAQPWHDVIGYATLALSVAPVLFGLRASPDTSTTQAAVRAVQAVPVSPVKIILSLICVLLAVGITMMPRQPVDVSRFAAPLSAPRIIAGEPAVLRELEAGERRYFQTYGGQAIKAGYGQLALTLVRTSSPLRHLHSPEDCLRGLGFDVTFLGTRFDPVPTALYRATDVSGASYHVAVSFVSNSGHVTSNVAEAIWLWFATPGSQWTSVQRITPWTQPEHRRAEAEAGVIAALRLSEIHQQETKR